MGRIFGTDGARGVANTEISCTLAMDIGRAAAMVVARDHKKKRPTFLVGHDTRISHDMLENAISAGLCSVGADVVTLGTVPTPAVAYLVANSDADAAIMLSASHNPYEFNGIKIFGSEGFKLTDEEEMEIEEIVLDHVLPYDLKWNDELGVIRSGDKMVEQYIDHIVSTVPCKLSGIKVAADCANGSASATAAKIFEKLGADVTIPCDHPNGVNINDKCGSTHIDVLSAYVKENGFDLGVAFDGDADRCLCVDEKGNLVDGDAILYIYGKYMKERGKLLTNTVVTTVMSNFGLYKAFDELGIGYAKTAVGDKYVYEYMNQNGCRIGGEQSGHIIFSKYASTGDGILTSLKMMEVMMARKAKMSQLTEGLTIYPQVLENVRVVDKTAAQEDPDVKAAVKAVEEALGDTGRILVRESGTEPLLRVMVEAETEECCRKYVDQVVGVVKAKGHVA